MSTVMQTYTGVAWDLRDPNPDNVRLLDIAVPLERMCRFNGHSIRHYSVLRHSMNVADLVGYKARPYALLHDAHEAYIGDITTPVAKALGSVVLPELKLAHDCAIFEAFGLGYPNGEIRAEIRDADHVALSCERGMHMGVSDCDWGDMPDPLLCFAGIDAKNSGALLQQFEHALRQYCPVMPEHGTPDGLLL